MRKAITNLNSAQLLELYLLYKAVENYCGWELKHILSKSRDTEYVACRAAIVTLMHEKFPELGWADLGMLIGRDHASAYYLIKTIKCQEKRKDYIEKVINNIRVLKEKNLVSHTSSLDKIIELLNIRLGVDRQIEELFERVKPNTTLNILNSVPNN